MCGICGMISPSGVQLKDIHSMSNAIAHRGPDDEGFYINGNIAMGIRRLSIIDLDGGRQPISNEDGSIWIVFNGEIYNYKALRKDLEKKGHTLKTRTDTEVIVHLYEDLGEKCVECLSGMFAFAIWDERHQKLFIARDRLGQKPLFFMQMGGSFLFGSEVKAILAVGDVKREIDFESLHHYLSLRFIPPPQTMIRGIRKLPPAHYLVFQDGQVVTSRYWDLNFQDKLNLTEEAFIDGLGEKLAEAVESHLVSDVPVGAFLSGGMDSSTIVANMAHSLPDPFMTFSIGVTEQDFNELPYARMVAERFGTCHIEERVEAKLLQTLPRIIWHLDEPSDPIAACFYHAAELASRHVKVVLGGDGGDELFAGFDRYLGILYMDRYTLIPDLIRQKIIGPMLDFMPDSFTYKSLTQKLRWINQVSLLPDTGERYAEATSFFRFNSQEKKQLYSDSLWQQLKSLDSSSVIVEKYRQANAVDPIDRMLYADFMTRLPEHSLMLTDRLTMAHSLEARSPFLDHSLVEFLAAFPSNLKIRNRELKYVLRRLAKKSLPVEIVNRQKQGFMFPIAYWFRNELYEWTKSFLLSSNLVKEGLFKRERISNLIEDHRRNKTDNHVRIWMLLNLEMWYRMYIGGQDALTLEAQIQHDFSSHPTH